MYLEDQLLPKDESFAAPDWLATTTGASAHNAPPYYWHYLQWKPTDGIATSYSTYPYRVSGVMETYGRSELYSLSNYTATLGMAAGMTDASGTGQLKQRGVLCRTEDSWAFDGISVKAVFRVSVVGGTMMGADTGGSGGSGPERRGFIQWPTAAGLSGIQNSGVELSENANSSGGGFNMSAPLGPSQETYSGWLGNSVVFRAGGGRPQIASGTTKYCYGTNFYSLVAYPEKNGANIDLVAEVWRVIFTTDSTSSNVPTLLAKQVISQGTTKLQFSQDYHLRAAIENVSGNPVITAFLGKYKTSAGIQDEVQLFKDGVFATDTITAGAGSEVTVNSTAGTVTDVGSTKITGNADKTVGFTMGRDRVQNFSTYTGATQAEWKQVIEGIQMLEVKKTDGSLLYRDLFIRSDTDSVGGGVKQRITNLFGNEGPQMNGLFTFDTDTQVTGSGNAERRKLMFWTDGATDTTDPNDYIQVTTDPDTSGTFVTNRARNFVYGRPSSQYYNHHRAITFKSPTDGSTAVANAFYIGVAPRGSTMNGQSNRSMAFYAYYGTNGSSAQTFLHFIVADLQFNIGALPTQNIIARKKVHTTGSAPSGFNLLDGSNHTLDFKCESYPGATTPNSAANYTCKFDGTAVVFDELFQDSFIDSSTGMVTHPSPNIMTCFGRSESFFFWSVQAPHTGSAANFVMPQFSAWTEGTLTADPEGSTTAPASVSVNDEGTAAVNLSTAIENVDWNYQVDYYRPRYEADFDSGHRYTSPQWGRARRHFAVSANYITRATMQAIVSFYNAREGMEGTFFFDVPHYNSSGAVETISACFSLDSLTYSRIAEDTYSVNFELDEVL